VRAVLLLAVLGGCSSLLGIEDPRPAGDAGPDASPDGMPPDHLVFSVTAAKLAQGQILRLHVQAVLGDGTTQDATASASFSSSDPTVATITGPVLSTGSQAGSTTITAQLGTATPATMTVTVTTALCHLVINELATGSASSAADEYVEVYNGCAGAIDVNGWTLVYRSATAVATDSTMLVALTGQMASGDLRLYAGGGFRGNNDGMWGGGTSGMLQQNNGAIGLRDGPIDVGTLVDSVAYGAVSPGHPFIETNPTMAMMNGRSASRLPFDGNDTNDGAADFMIIATQTPHALNAP
jgi:hypothetical protein